MKDLIHRIAIRFFATPQKPRGEILRDLASVLIPIVSYFTFYALSMALLINQEHSAESAFRLFLNSLGLLLVVFFASWRSTAHQFFMNALMLVATQTLSFFAPELLAKAPLIDSYLARLLTVIENERRYIVLGLTCLAGLVTLGVVASLPINLLSQYLFSRFDFCRSIKTPWRHVIPFTKQDHRSIAIHEAGHAIIMALDPLIDDNCKVYLAQDPADGTFGYCRHARWPHNIHSRDYYVMRMVGYLAGVEAERLVIGSPGMGGSSDYRIWLELAQRMMRTDPDEVFFPDPKTAPEIEHNRLALNDMRRKHQAIARKILEVNQEVLEQLAARLMECFELKGPELLGFLERVKPIEDMPDLSFYYHASTLAHGA
ncbi:hypothetical protein [Pseudomonas viridiflava]|uniref:hypothetical protein n=1 Tax=Pseudomonas viridiflava TaxID=33069 RepID=UPI000F038C63|nr:hypothetical protein [Pseudomonas viridiflava]